MELPNPAPSRSSRWLALDWLRGLVMILMTVDHASSAFNGQAIAPDSYLFGMAGTELTPSGSAWPFWTRWVTHLCAPAFVFLAGTSVALSVSARTTRGASRWEIDGHLIARGMLLILLEFWMMLAWPMQVFQVLYAIGASFILIAFLRHLPTWLTVGAALLWIALGEAAVSALDLRPSADLAIPFLEAPPVWASFLAVPRFEMLESAPVWLGRELLPYRMINYPLLGWLAILLLGHAFGRYLLLRVPRKEGLALRVGALSLMLLLAFVVLRSNTEYGNFWLPLQLTEDDPTPWLRWLQVSKYPPSLAFTLLELGLAGCLLAGFLAWEERSAATSRGPKQSKSLLTTLGQTALPFYLIHLHLLHGAAELIFGYDPTDSSARPPFGVGAAWFAAAVCVLILWPVCLALRAWKRKRPGGLWRLL